MGTAGAQSDQMNIRSNTPSRPGDTGGRTRRNKPRRRNRGDVTEYERTHTLESIEENGGSAKPALNSFWPRFGGLIYRWCHTVTRRRVKVSRGLRACVPSNRSDNVAHLSCEFFSRFPTAVEWPCCHRKPSKSDFFNELKTPSSQHPSVAQIFHSWKRVVFQIPPDGLASERLSVGIETKFAQGRN
jgi:hypothetical protein